MSDTQLERYLQYGTNAARLAFTPNPPAATSVLYEWYETDTGATYVYDTSWHLVTSAASVTTTGTPASGNLAKFSGAATITNGNLSGDVTTAGTLAATLANTAVTPASYQGANLTVDSKGRLTAAASGVRSVTVTLNDAQIKALPTTPFQLVAAPAAGFYNNFLWATLNCNASAGAYATINAAGFLFCQWAGGALCSAYLANDPTLTIGTALTGLSQLFATANHRAVKVAAYQLAVQENDWGLVADPVFDITLMAAKAIQLKVNNAASGDFTGGNAANSLLVTTYYTVDALA